jgi:hypothetical protein
MSPSMSRCMIGFVFVFFLAVSGCVDYQEPTGPLPTPPPDEGGELTSSLGLSGGSASGTGRPASRAPRSGSASAP